MDYISVESAVRHAWLYVYLIGRRPVAVNAQRLDQASKCEMVLDQVTLGQAFLSVF